MKQWGQALAAKLWSDFQAFSAGQKIVALASLGALLVGGYFLFAWRPAPTYAPLYTNLAAADASAIVDKLTAQNVSYQLGAGGTEILVPQDKVYSTRLAMSSAGLPGSAQSGYSLLDKEGVTTSQFKQQIDYQRAIEGELAKTIQTVGGVTAASVHLAIPQQDVFNDGSSKPTAAVLLSVSPSTVLTSSQVQSVVYLVSSSVPGMTVDGVTVSDSNGNVLKAPGSGVDAVASTDTQAKATQAYENSIAASIQTMIDKAIGPNHAAVTVNSVLDFSSTKVTKRSYLYNVKAPPLSATVNKETYQGAGGTSGTLGTVGAATTTPAGNGKYIKTNSTVDNALGTVTQSTENAPGQLQRLSIAVLLDKSVKNLNVGAISKLVRSGVGFNAARGDALSVQAMPFDNSAQRAAALAGVVAAKAASAKAAHEQLIGWIKQGALGLLVFGLLVAALIGSRRRRPRGPVEQQDNVLGMGDFADQDTAFDDLPARLAPVSDFEAAAARRRTLTAAADDRPQDVARVLSSWLSTKES